MNAKKIIYLMFVAFALIASSCGNKQNKANSSTAQEESLTGSNRGQAFIKQEGDANALALAKKTPDFSTLVAAVQAAQVENALVNVGPLTVFAPTNAAFDKIDKATLDDLLKPENRAKLAFILTNHVAPSNYPISTLKVEAKKGHRLFMASGEYEDIEVKGNDVFVGGVRIEKSIKSSNGWVHVINEVILPKKQ